MSHEQRAGGEWFSVRCLIQHTNETPPELMIGQVFVYEERITLWQADGFDEAIRLAEEEASQYADSLDGLYRGLAT